MKSWLQPNRIISIVALGLGIYAAIMIYSNLSKIYSTSSNFFEDASSVYPIGLTALIALSPFAYFGIALLAYFDRKSYLVFVLFIYGAFIFFSYALLILAGLLVWCIFFTKKQNQSSDNKINVNVA